MDFKLTETTIQGCILLNKPRFEDNRGEFVKSFNNTELKSAGLDFLIAEVFYSNSKKNVLRGMHFQTPPFDHTKLVTCLGGHILDVVVDLRYESQTYQKAIGIELQGFDGNSLLIPKGCAHGFYSFSDDSIVGYLVETGYSPSHDSGVLWNSLDFKWPIDNPIVSVRDSQFQKIQDYKAVFTS